MFEDVTVKFSHFKTRREYLLLPTTTTTKKESIWELFAIFFILKT